MSVLVAIDGSRSSIRALMYVAARVRRGERLKVNILYVQPQTMPTKFVNKMTITEWLNEDRARVLGNPRVKTLKQGLKARIAIRNGDAPLVIHSFAIEHKCAEIVMGTRGLSSMKGLLLGSVTTKVVQLSKVPVTLVK